MDPASGAGRLTWVRFPSPAPLSGQAEASSAGASQSSSRELVLDRAVVPSLHSVPRWLVSSGAGPGFTRGRRWPTFVGGRIASFEADIRIRVLSATSGHPSCQKIAPPTTGFRVQPPLADGCSNGPVLQSNAMDPSPHLRPSMTRSCCTMSPILSWVLVSP
jgi:hypothetical protein